MRKTNAAAIAEPAPGSPAVVPNVILTWHDAYRRVQQALLPMGRTCFSTEEPRRVPWEPGARRIFHIELRDGGNVTEIAAADFEGFARSLGVIQECEKPFGVEWGIE